MTHRTSPLQRITPYHAPSILVAIVFSVIPALANEGSSSLYADSDPRLTADVVAVQRAAPSVVNIHSVKLSDEDATVFGSADSRKVNGMGTGIVIDARGYIVTNHHVVADVISLRCTMRDGSTYEATTLAVDPTRDLALIKVNPTQDLPVIPLGTSSDLMMCETVIAIGNAFGYEHTVTKGIISALHRDVEVNETQSYKNLIQTDASINPGNSGGPLLNMRGEVIGINVAIRAGAQRIGFAIPIDDARLAIAELLDVERMGQITYGLTTKDVKTGSMQQLVIESVEESGPGRTAGFLPGDVISQVDGKPVSDRVDLERYLLNRDAGTAVDVLVQRGGNDKSLALTLAATTETPSEFVAHQDREPSVDGDAEDASWRILGLRLGSAEKDAVKGTNYSGGLKVLAVREGSPAAMTGIQSGDILVGLHEWATVKSGDVDWVLRHPQLSKFSPLRFYVLGNRGKGQKTLSGRLTLASAK